MIFLQDVIRKIQKKKNFFIGANTNIIDDNPCLPFSHKKQKTKPKTTKNRKKRKEYPRRKQINETSMKYMASSLQLKVYFRRI